MHGYASNTDGSSDSSAGAERRIALQAGAGIGSKCGPVHLGAGTVRNSKTAPFDPSAALDPTAARPVRSGLGLLKPRARRTGRRLARP